MGEERFKGPGANALTSVIFFPAFFMSPTELKTISPDKIWEVPFRIEIHNPNKLDLVDPFKVQTLQETEEGDLKHFSRENAIKLKRMLLRRGFDIPFFRFILPSGSEYLADGYGRRKLFLEQAPLDLKGKKIKKFPALNIYVNDIEEAAERLLEITSKVNIATPKGFTWYLKTYNLDRKEIEVNTNLVEIAPPVKLKEKEAPPEGSETPGKPKDPETLPGDLYELKSVAAGITHRVICGDSTVADHVDTLLAGAKPVLMVTDPPYGVEYDANWRNEAAEKGQIAAGARVVGKVKNDTRADWSEAYTLFPGQVCYIWHSDRFAYDFYKSVVESGFIPINMIIWVKPKHVISRGDYHSKHEPCIYAHRKGKTHNWQGSRSEFSTWEIVNSQDKKLKHSTQKPIDCMKKPILNNSAEREEVYDPFLGSGTTLIAAEQSERILYGIEIDTGYTDVIVKRWVNYMKDSGREYELLRNGKPCKDFD